jgi:hypothetical protein
MGKHRAFSNCNQKRAFQNCPVKFDFLKAWIDLRQHRFTYTHIYNSGNPNQKNMKLFLRRPTLADDGSEKFRKMTRIEAPRVPARPDRVRACATWVTGL